ncbi:MAG: ABC transporter permease [Chloroflexi bacterium]|nr:ABC transporter permease [Chloroflexota bacterium]
MSIATRDEVAENPEVPLRRRVAARLTPGAEAWLLRLVAAVAIIGTWEGIVRAGLLTEFWISRPGMVAARLVDWLIVRGSMWDHLAATLQAVAIGLSGGIVLGIVSGLVLAKWQRLQVALDPFIMGLYSMPRAALAPLFIMWLGIGIESKIVLAGFVAFFVLLINTYAGVKNVDPDLLNAVRTMGGSGTFLVHKVVLPSCVPWILSGTRIGLAFSLTGAVFAEMLAAQKGVGWLISRSSGLFDTTGVFASILVLAVVAMGLNEGMKKLERWLLRWQGEVVL